MSPQPQPKVILFDIGGVCVLSPFQAILDHELSLGIPPGWINYSISKSAPNGFWHRLERGEIPLNSTFYDGFTRDLHKPDQWTAFYKREQAKQPSLSKEVPPMPTINGEWLFNEMMSPSGVSNPMDPWMFPALQKLKQSGKFLIAALSNTVIFPPGHRLHKTTFFADALQEQFDVVVSSAHVGLRKPDPRIYKLAVEMVDRFARENAATPQGQTLGWEGGISASDILFLDDIGENLKAAKNQGFGTIKVHLGRAYEAVEELEKVTRLQLEGDHPKIAIKPQIRGPKVKI